MKLFWQFLFVFTLVFTTQVYAQRLEIQWGDPQDYLKDGYIRKIIGSDENGYYALRQVSIQPPQSIIKYNLQHEKEFELPITAPDKNWYWQGAYLLKDNVVILVYHTDSKKNTTALYGYTISKDGKQSELTMLQEIPSKNLRTIPFTAYVSEDKNSILTISEFEYYRNKPQPLGCKLFTSKFERIWEKSITLSDNKNEFDVRSCRIDEEGNLFILGIYGYTYNYDPYRLFAYYHKQDKLQEVDFNLPKDYELRKLKLFYSDGYLTLVGFGFSPKPYRDDMFYFKISSKTLQPMVQKSEPFSAMNLSKIAINKNEKGLNSYYKIDTIIGMPSGDIKVIAEYVDVPNPKLATGNSRYFHKNIIVITLDMSGAVKWVANIPKQQLGYSNDQGEFSSYILASDEENLYILYNDDPKNSAQENLRKKEPYETTTGNLSKISVTLATVNNNGEVTKETFIKNESGLVLKPQLNMHAGKDKVLIHSVKGYRIYQFGYLNIK